MAALETTQMVADQPLVLEETTNADKTLPPVLISAVQHRDYKLNREVIVYPYGYGAAKSYMLDSYVQSPQQNVGTISFRSKGRTYLMRPLVLEDASWLTPDQQPTSVEEMLELLNKNFAETADQ
jgi:hypothetical protein